MLEASLLVGSADDFNPTEAPSSKKGGKGKGKSEISPLPSGISSLRLTSDDIAELGVNDAGQTTPPTAKFTFCEGRITDGEVTDARGDVVDELTFDNSNAPSTSTAPSLAPSRSLAPSTSAAPTGKSGKGSKKGDDRRLSSNRSRGRRN